MVILLLIFFAVLIVAFLLDHINEIESEKEEKKRRIEAIQSYVISSFDELLEDAEDCGEDYYASLNDFADKMEKLSAKDIKDDLRPYDIYNVKMLSNNMRSHSLGRIVIDKNLMPKFMLTPPSLYRDKCDIELDVAYTSSKVKELADKCRKVKMGIDIERFRKNKVKEIIDGK